MKNFNDKIRAVKFIKSLGTKDEILLANGDVINVNDLPGGGGGDIKPDAQGTLTFDKTKKIKLKYNSEEKEVATSDNIPTKTSQLQNDSGYLTEHQDISGKADKSEIPTKVSQLENDSNFSSLPDITKVSEGFVFDNTDQLKLKSNRLTLEDGTKKDLDKYLEERGSAITYYATLELLQDNAGTYSCKIIGKEDYPETVQSDALILIDMPFAMNNAYIKCSRSNIEKMPTKGTNAVSISDYIIYGFGNTFSHITIVDQNYKILVWMRKTTNTDNFYCNILGIISSEKIVATTNQIPTVPTKTSELINDSNFINQVKALPAKEEEKGLSPYLISASVENGVLTLQTGRKVCLGQLSPSSTDDNTLYTIRTDSNQKEKGWNETQEQKEYIANSNGSALGNLIVDLPNKNCFNLRLIKIGPNATIDIDFHNSATNLSLRRWMQLNVPYEFIFRSILSDAAYYTLNIKAYWTTALETKTILLKKGCSLYIKAIRTNAIGTPNDVVRFLECIVTGEVLGINSSDTKHQVMTMDEYNALTTKEPDTFYYITD